MSNLNGRKREIKALQEIVLPALDSLPPRLSLQAERVRLRAENLRNAITCEERLVKMKDSDIAAEKIAEIDGFLQGCDTREAAPGNITMAENLAAMKAHIQQAPEKFVTQTIAEKEADLSKLDEALTV